MNIEELKVRLSPSKKVGFVCFNESHLKMIKNAFYFMSKAFFVHEIIKACVRYFKTNFYLSLNDSPSKTMKDVFYFI